MSEKSKFNWDAVKPGGEQNEDYLASIVKELNAINRKTGRPEVKLVSTEEARTGLTDEERQAELARGKEIELANAKEVEVAMGKEAEIQEAKDREIEQSRGFDVRRIMAEDEADKAKEAAKESAKVREIVPEKEIVRQTSSFDPEMQEITLEKGKRKEIDVIGQGTKPVDEKLAEKVDKIMAMRREYAEIKEKMAKLRGPEPEQPAPLTAVGVDWTKSEDRMARKMAREDLKDELKDASLIKRIWKGKLFRNIYEDIYMDEYLTGERVNKDGDSLYDIIDKQKDEMMDGIVFDVAEEVREENKAEMDKRLVPMDKETNEKIKSTIEDYARFMYEINEIRPDMANDPEFVAEVDRKFDRYMINILENAENEGRIDGYIESNNYLDVAKEAANRYKEAIRTARSKVEQDGAMAKVMYGFQAYNYESTKRFSSEHRSNIDKIMDKLGSKKVVSAETFSRAVDETAMEGEDAIVDNIKKAEELIGGKEGIKIMLDKSPISVESQARWKNWWDGLSDEGRDYVKELVKQVNAYPDRYNLKWGNGFRTWLTIINARDILAA